MQIHGQGGGLRDPLDHGGGGHEEAAGRRRGGTTGLARAPRARGGARQAAGATGSKTGGVPDALRCGPQAVPIQRVTRRQRWRLDSFRHESCVAVFYHHTIFLPYGPLRRCDVPMQQYRAIYMLLPGLQRVPSFLSGYLIMTDLTRTCLCKTAHMECMGG